MLEGVTLHEPLERRWNMPRLVYLQSYLLLIRLFLLSRGVLVCVIFPVVPPAVRESIHGVTVAALVIFQYFIDEVVLLRRAWHETEQVNEWVDV